MKFANKTLDLSIPRVMGILNVTPDSFSDGGRYNHLDSALRQTKNMLCEGADFIDVGGESTRPGAKNVSVQQELDRVVPVIEAISRNFDTLISIDTSKAQVMTEAVKAGAVLINDVRALQEDGALIAASSTNAAVCLMHMQGQPRTMQHQPHYDDLLGDISAMFRQRLEACSKAGIRQERVLLDPGFGFGKSLQHNYQLLNQLGHFHQLGCPLLVGMSRKSMLGKLLNNEVEERLAGSLACATIAAIKGAQIIRVHDVKPTADALKVVQATLNSEESRSKSV
ncbi:dihydropteroate synthase [Lacimicrobium alkaliphilum]|uniref:Dihydropteroate synthase n=1 Tax=Lacimicrobium alkaliphilum TaxID=1526571 RepID=A0ABQ1RN83_9ALTE|nr:dihydropteroate synthase [Lacimicrobium alkaliphilum]GGD75627.1 dihydropteroate synthase [Lacimicrobium alkaliphilum]